MGSVFKALSDPTRRRILQLLRDGDLTAGEIAGNFVVSRPAITKHLEILREAELVTSEKQGQFIRYSLNVTVLQETLSGFLDYFARCEDVHPMDLQTEDQP